ncbi:hypothetical protein BDN67DRAFT_985156, partial [Paxillus ammoniavirescens]
MTSIFQGTTSLTTHSFVSPPPPFSPLPSPPTSPISPGTGTATRIRLKASRRQSSMGFVSSPTTPGEGKGTTRSASPSTLKLMTAEGEHPSGTGGGTITPTSASVKAKRRQSSIAYFTPSSPSPWDQRPGLTRTASGSGPAGISRIEGTASNAECVSSAGNGENRGIATPAGPVKRTSLVLSTRTNSNRESACSFDDVGGREREPLTLVEKRRCWMRVVSQLLAIDAHDLLHFIAQKERKCLELRDQLSVHERELAELKRKWERIVNRGFTPGGGECDPPPHLTLNAGLGGVAFDGLKEGVRMIAAGLSDLGGVIQDPEQDEKGDPVVKPGYRTGTHAQRESDSSVSASTGFESRRISTSSVSSIWDAEYNVDGSGETKAVVTAPPLSRAGSVNSSVHKRGSQARSKEYSAPPSAYVSPVSVSRSRSTSVDLEVSVASTANPAPVQLLSSPISASKPVSSTAGANPAMPISTSQTASDLAPPSSIPGLTMGGPVSSW